VIGRLECPLLRNRDGPRRLHHALQRRTADALQLLPRREFVHDAEALEGVLAVVQLALVDRAQVLLDVAAVECGAAEDHRRREAALVQRHQVFLHDDRRLHQ
jgi:hypothetical protein